MFTSKQHLHVNMGVDPDIAAFFVDRKVPENNLYWKGRYLYVAFGTGYLFMPLYSDLQFKSGVPKSMLLDENYLAVCESILHSAALHEGEEISFSEHIHFCKQILDGKVKDFELFKDLATYFADGHHTKYKYLGTGSRALNRGDSFLFALSQLELPADVMKKCIEQWYALVPAFLLMDDITDMKEDLQKNEENAILEFGSGTAAMEKAFLFLRDQFNLIKTANVRLAQYLEASLKDALETPYFKSILNY